jgi:paraquat-inducible protein A
MSKHIVCCHACDELCCIKSQQNIGRFSCPACGSLIFRYHAGMIEKVYAYAIASLILFGVVNYFPFLSFEVAGNLSHANFLTSTVYMFKEQEWLLGVVVLMTILVIPLMRIILFILLFAPLYHGKVPPYAVTVLKMLEYASVWGMLDVFLVGVLVSMVKLVKMGTIIPGTSLWAFVVLVFVMTAMQVAYNPHMVWEIVESHKRPQKDQHESN